MSSNRVDNIKPISGSSIPEVLLLPQLKEIDDLISRTCEYFFKTGTPMPNSPFKGFLLEGSPGLGKTEIIKQVARKLDRRLGGTVYWLFIDGASIAAPRWGDAEKALKSVFQMINNLKSNNSNAKLIIHFDDIESLMLARGINIAKEWHYSINSILFHELDNIDPSQTIICATTNRIELVDEALKDRLFIINMPAITLDQLKIAVIEILEKTRVVNSQRDDILDSVLEQLGAMKSPTLRSARSLTVIECIKKRVWSA